MDHLKPGSNSAWRTGNKRRIANRPDLSPVKLSGLLGGVLSEIEHSKPDGQPVFALMREHP